MSVDLLIEKEIGFVSYKSHNRYILASLMRCSKASAKAALPFHIFQLNSNASEKCKNIWIISLKTSWSSDIFIAFQKPHAPVITQANARRTDTRLPRSVVLRREKLRAVLLLTRLGMTLVIQDLPASASPQEPLDTHSSMYVFMGLAVVTVAAMRNRFWKNIPWLSKSGLSR